MKMICPDKKCNGNKNGNCSHARSHEHRDMCDNPVCKPCVPVKEESMSYEEKQALWVKLYDVKVGDKVKVLRVAKSGEGGWDNVWPYSPTGEIGNVCNITSGNIAVQFPCDWHNLPWFVLEKVADAPKADDLETKIKEIDFGCNQEKVLDLCHFLDERYKRKAKE